MSFLFGMLFYVLKLFNAHSVFLISAVCFGTAEIFRYHTLF